MELSSCPHVAPHPAGLQLGGKLDTHLSTPSYSSLGLCRSRKLIRGKKKKKAVAGGDRGGDGGGGY